MKCKKHVDFHNYNCEDCQKEIKHRGSSSASVACYEDLASEIVDEIIRDLTGRKGLRHEYRLCDEDIREEIKDAWAKIIEDRLGKSL